jgi:DegV family protein with EDD domain
MIKIVTDSVSDIPKEIAKELDITVIPTYVHFGNEVYKNGIDITTDEFYRKLEKCTELPTTSAPSPGLFATAFDELAEKCTGIVGIFISHKFSATYDAAVKGIDMMKKKCQVKVIDSGSAIMVEGIMAIEAAKKAREGASLDEIVNLVADIKPRLHMRSTLDDFSYLLKGGRIGRVQAWLGTMMKVNPINTIEDGVAVPVARVRTREKATDWLCEYAASFKGAKAVAVEYGLNVDEGKTIVQRIAAVFPEIPIYLSQISPIIGAHAGPGMIAVTVLD